MNSSKENIETFEGNPAAIAPQDFFTIGLNRTKLASMIYGVSKSKEEGMDFHEKCFVYKTLTLNKLPEPSSSRYADKRLND